jgi:hypothetical protein
MDTGVEWPPRVRVRAVHRNVTGLVSNLLLKPRRFEGKNRAPRIREEPKQGKHTMNKKSTKSTKPAAPQVKSAKTSSVSPAKTKEAKPAKKAVVRSKKPAPAVKVAPPPPAPATPKVVAPAPVAASAPPPAVPRITVTAQIDIGFGNQLFIRGEGGSLSWEVGRLMDCVADDQWSAVFDDCAGPVAFKLLVNDLNWSAGENYVASPGDAIVVAPVF